ncbi:MAG: Plastocyanin [Candidatus Methanoperedens nitroreducens]|uniref:Plastocyanin n=1 Tax=Candidatus Methanoperedens nitratireducens TaxID=1392998 RepID=A0A0P7ZDE8_9EURY|nr:cupredoxin domain-containing protein [Candidatus Methanoperedens sp. BLZ2]KAB2947693.1 MAG: cupredoxin domain-containing protein [Candidatus Methanoperedens sp.]KPQ42700.1 MAG: Plastocyanin [Candidatus Methanoperedens sp. BLZ1]MBZ0176246.1 cupredoxin domain-containing protein [Candidatus Methanoperedens nitroreducens]MCX9077471.1 cupredoxin domain-containing protein [Candidatus Methanoperedens sp.]
MSRSKKYKGKMSREKQRKKLPYMSILFVVIVIAIFSSATYLVVSKTASLEPEDKEAIKMTISMVGFEPNVIRAKVGQPVKINLINPDNSMHTDGGGIHNFNLKESGVSNVNITVLPESQKVFTFTPMQAGEYHWYCESCCGGKENPSMHGTLIVA